MQISLSLGAIIAYISIKILSDLLFKVMLQQWIQHCEQSKHDSSRIQLDTSSDAVFDRSRVTNVDDGHQLVHDFNASDLNTSTQSMPEDQSRKKLFDSQICQLYIRCLIASTKFEDAVNFLTTTTLMSSSLRRQNALHIAYLQG
jgi:hypothetical protein